MQAYHGFLSALTNYKVPRFSKYIAVLTMIANRSMRPSAHGEGQGPSADEDLHFVHGNLELLLRLLDFHLSPQGLYPPRRN